MRIGFLEELENLNSYQREAVLDESPACVVNANVGSGKTTVLIAKILYLHLGQGKTAQASEQGVPLEDMVVLTFTNKAANEITERLLKKEPTLSKEQVQCFGTFHSVALYLLKNRLQLDKAGWNRDFAVMDPDEEADLAAELIAEHGLKVKYKNRLKKRLEQEFNAYLQKRECSRYKDDLFLLYPLLEAEKKRQNKMSFSDLLRVSTALLKEGEWHPKWIIVDEVQDSDALQIDFLEALRGEDTRFFAVGDPNQVIYSWRGTLQNTFYVLKHRFGARELSLPINYRSNAAILEAANRFLQYGNKIQGAREAGNRIVVKNHYDPFLEAEYLAERIRALHEEGCAYCEIAVFYRLQKQSELLEKVFEKHQIPCEVSVKKTIKDIPVLDWLVKVLRYACNPADEQMGMQVLMDGQYGEKCTRKKAKELIVSGRSKVAHAQRESDQNAASGQEENAAGGQEEKAAGGQEEKAAGGQEENAAGWSEQRDIWSGLNDDGCKKKDSVWLFQRMLGFSQQTNWLGTEIPSAEEIFGYFGLREALHPTSASYMADEKLVMDFLRALCTYCKENGASFVQGTRDYVNSAALYGANILETETDETRDAVRLMTLHASKGLEFDMVFLIGVNQGLIPLRSPDIEQEEEESRLFFVGITRARNRLELSYYTNPGEPGVLGECSRYLKRIPEELLDWDACRSDADRRQNLQELRREVRAEIRGKEEPRSKMDSGNEAREKEEPRLARHPKYGVGVVVSENEMIVEVEFEGYGRKEFLKAFGEVEID